MKKRGSHLSKAAWDPARVCVRYRISLDYNYSIELPVDLSLFSHNMPRIKGSLAPSHKEWVKLWFNFGSTEES